MDLDRAVSSTSEVLAINCGSSSLKYALFAGEDVALRGAVEHVGQARTPDHRAAVAAVFATLTARGLGTPRAVGHRLVHGGPDHLEPARVDAALLSSLAGAIPFAPLHLPVELAAIEAVRELRRSAPGCPRLRARARPRGSSR